jgi:hypothetical protein
MATTTIASEIQGITGVTTADANFIVSGQKFVVASIPKNLMKWASSQSGVMTSNADSDAVLNVDTILSVKRNGYPCREISSDDLVWAADTNSLKKATTTHPIYVVSGGKIQIQPEPAVGQEGYYYYVDYTKVDDDSDLRNIVINYACFKEFAKLMMRDELQGKYEQYSTFFKDSTCDLSLDSTTVTHDANASIVVGLEVSNDLIPAGTYVQIINSSTEFELSNAATSQLTNATLTFSSEGFGTEHWIETEEDSEMLMARIQTIQAQIGERTHFGQLSQQHYNLALAEIKSYIENNPKTLAAAMAMQGAK